MRAAHVRLQSRWHSNINMFAHAHTGTRTVVIRMSNANNKYSIKQNTVIEFILLIKKHNHVVSII